MSLRQAPDMSVVVLVLDDVVLLVVTRVVVGTAHDGVPPEQLHCPDLQKKRMPFRHSRFALPLKPAHRALMAGLQRLRLHGLRASTGPAERTSPKTSPTMRPTTSPNLEAPSL